MRSENKNRNNRNERSGNGNRTQSYAGSYRNQSGSNYNDYDREYNDNERDYNTYDRSDAGRYSNYEGNYGRGNYENDYSNRNNDYYSSGRHSAGSGSNGGNNRTWDSQEPGYYSTRYKNSDRGYSEYGGTRRRDEKDWSDGRNYASEYNNDGSYYHPQDRGFFERVGDRIRDTWHDMTDRDDTRDNMRRFRESDSYGRRSSSNNSYDNRGNYRPYPQGSSDESYGSSTRARNNNRGAYGDSRNEYGGYGVDRQDFNW